MTAREPPRYEVAVVGGGPAGLTTALYATRLGHRTALFEKEGGRHAAAKHVHNLVGVSEDVSGRDLAEHGVRQLESYGADFYPDAVEAVRRRDGDDDGSERFRLEAARSTVRADRVVFATGFTDLGPQVSGLERFTGRGLHYCLHCDAYTLGDAPAFVLGHDESAAHVAMTLCNVTDDVDLLLDGRAPEWDDETETRLAGHPIDRVDAEVVSAYAQETAERSSDGAARDDAPGGDDEPWLGGFSFADGTERSYHGGFAMYGTAYNADLAADLGCAVTDEGSIAVDDRFETSVDGAYAVGDVTHGQNQTTIAIGDGAKAGLALHKDLRRFPLSLEEVEAREDEDTSDGRDEGENSSGAVDAPGAPADLRARMRRVRDLEVHPGLRDPRPD